MTNSRSILITGATSGIGMYAANLFAQRGWIVWAGYRNEKGRVLLSKINPKQIRPIRIDVTDIQSITQAHATITKSKIPLHVLCNNAGIAFGAPVELLDIGEVQKAFDVNFFGPLRMIQVFLPLLRQTSGRIVNIGSVSGLVGIPFEVPTSAPKFALEGMSDALRREIIDQNVSVSIIEPGIIRTEIWPKSIRLSLKLLKSKQEKLKLYKQATDNLMDLFEKNSKVFAPLHILKKPLIHAVESRNPKRRYLVYRYSIVLRLLITFLPDILVDLLFRKVLEKSKPR
jgi:NAD(P)-dependent dehydrogenase (short-subunit alcohol dehydrogenase family)